MPNLSFRARPEVLFSLALALSLSLWSPQLESFTDSVANQNMRISNRPDVQSQHPGAGSLIQGPAGGVNPGQGPPPGQNMEPPGHGGFQYK